MSKLFNSRKFLILLLDSAFALAAVLVAFFVSDPEVTVLVGSIFGILQPLFVGVVVMIGVEDSAAYAAGAHPSQLG
jgi:hypothetical protein